MPHATAPRTDTATQIATCRGLMRRTAATLLMRHLPSSGEQPGHRAATHGGPATGPPASFPAWEPPKRARLAGPPAPGEPEGRAGRYPSRVILGRWCPMGV